MAAAIAPAELREGLALDITGTGDVPYRVQLSNEYYDRRIHCVYYTLTV